MVERFDFFFPSSNVWCSLVLVLCWFCAVVVFVVVGTLLVMIMFFVVFLQWVVFIAVAVIIHACGC